MNNRTFDRLWEDYQSHHHAAGNKYCHMAGIPLIILGLVGLVSVPVFRVGPWPVEAALLLVLVTGLVYISLDWKLGSAMVGANLALYFAGRLLNWKVALAVFLLGWIFQFIGHGVYEKRRPAFYKNITHLLIGPLWVLNHWVHIRREQSGTTASAGSS